MFKTISQSIMRGRKKGIIYVHVNCFWDSKLLLDAKMNPEKWAHKTKKIPFHDSFRCFRSQTRSFLTKLNQKVPSRGMFNALQLLKGAQTQQTKPTPLMKRAQCRHQILGANRLGVQTHPCWATQLATINRATDSTGPYRYNLWTNFSY